MERARLENMLQWSRVTLGVKVVLVKSFARIHETNLKKQGMLGLTFKNEKDYDLIKEDDVFNFIDLSEFSPGKKLIIEVLHSDGTLDTIEAITPIISNKLNGSRRVRL